MHRSSRRSRGCAVGSSTPCPVGSRQKSIYGGQTCIRGRCGRQLQSHRKFPRQPPLYIPQSQVFGKHVTSPKHMTARIATLPGE